MGRGLPESLVWPKKCKNINILPNSLFVYTYMFLNEINNKDTNEAHIFLAL